MRFSGFFYVGLLAIVVVLVSFADYHELRGYGSNIISAVHVGEMTPLVKASSALTGNITVERLRQQTIDFIDSRRKAFDQVGMGSNWWLRGLGYLYTIRDIALAMEPMPETVQGTPRIRILNVHPNATGSDCDKLTIWARVRGPEMVAASATAVDSPQGCYWEYQADVRVPGAYHIDAKVLLWNAMDVNYSEMKCGVEKGDISDRVREKYPTHAGFKGFKMYGADQTCCEICTRLNPFGCVHWVNPAYKLGGGVINNGCELFFDNDTIPERIPRSHLLHDLNTTFNRRRRLENKPKYRHGVPHNGQKAWFVGCGWNQFFTLDFPCLSGDLDDKVFQVKDSFELQVNEEPNRSDTLPLCSLEDEKLGASHGRWVREAWPTHKECKPMEFDKDFKTKFDIVKWDGARPHCWHRDDLSKIGHRCIEPNCRLIRPESKYISPWREKQWIGVWRERSCDLLEFTDQQLQTCIDKRKIKEFKVTGRSISQFMEQYLLQRLVGLQLYNDLDDSEAKSVELTTLGMLHKAGRSDDELIQELQKLPSATANKLYFAISLFYVTSERERNTHLGNIMRLYERMSEVLPEKGYNMLNLFDPSIATVFDTATQFDGMHQIGPPMKLAITKFFHYLCVDYTEGSRM